MKRIKGFAVTQIIMTARKIGEFELIIFSGISDEGCEGWFVGQQRESIEDTPRLPLLFCDTKEKAIEALASPLFDGFR